MTDREALLRGILADPADDTPRLVYADWLEENGRCDYAEFIRLQVELATATKGGVPNHRELELWHQLPTAATFAPWSTGITIDPSQFKFWFGNRAGPECIVSRGFVAAVRCRLADWFAHGSAIVAAHPVESVRFTDYPSRRLDPANMRTEVEWRSESLGPAREFLVHFDFDHRLFFSERMLRSSRFDMIGEHEYTRRACDASLSWARHYVGLPPLTPPRPT